MAQTGEPVLVQALVPKAPVEALDEGVLGRFPRLDQLQLHIVLAGPLVQRPPRELGTLIRANGPRQATKAHRLIENSGDVRSRDAAVGLLEFLEMDDIAGSEGGIYAINPDRDAI